MTLAAQRRVLALAAALAVAATLAVAPGPAVAGHSSFEQYFDLSALPAPGVTGKEIVDDLEAFADAYPYRLTGGPTEVLAGEFLRDSAAALGYETAIEPLPVTGGLPGSPLKVVTAKKEGTTRPDDWIMFVGHYDTVPQTIWGTYDNAAGTNLMLQLARALADVPTNRSIVFAWYNGEEQGLLASARHAAALKASGQQISAVLGFDMVGIAWPVAPEVLGATHCLCMFHGSQDGANFRPLLEFVNFDFLDYERGGNKVFVVGNNSRNSDERSFANQGYPSMRWAGMRSASNYPAYHLPHDTLDTMIQVAGGREYVEAGSFNTLQSAYYTALTVDNHLPEPDFAVQVDGLTVSVTDRSVDQDLDEGGALSDLVWAFGDGATATGSQASHTYETPGTYAITLMVPDNLWPDVTVTVSASVTVN